MFSQTIDAHQRLSPSQSSASVHVRAIWDTFPTILPH